MKTKIISMLSFLATLALVNGNASAATIVLDDYSTDDSGNYTNDTYYPPGVANNTYDLATSSGVGTVSSGTQDTTQVFFYTPAGLPAVTLGLGDTVSLDVTAEVDATDIVGLVLADSPTDSSKPNFGIFIGAENNDGYSDGTGVAVFSPAGTKDIGTPATITGYSSTGFSTLSVTRLASDPTGESFSYTLTGNGLSDSGTFTDTTGAADAPIYFGPSYYNASGTTAEQFDNLTLTTASVPEPSSVALFLVGALFFWGGMRCRKASKLS